MQYKIEGKQLPIVTCTLNNGEKIVTESGGMAWMDDCFEMDSNTRGGVLKGLGRALSGDSIFMTTYTATKDQANITFGSSFPGCILPIEMHSGSALIAQKSAYLAGEDGVNVEMHFKKKLGAGLFGGEGFILQKISGDGMVFLEIDGDVIEKTLAPNEVIKVDQGYIAAFEETVDFDITTIKGIKNKFLSGEGFFVATLKGPGKVWLQTMPFNVLADRIISLVPSK